MPAELVYYALQIVIMQRNPPSGLIIYSQCASHECQQLLNRY
jgi:hypothetical protein